MYTALLSDLVTPVQTYAKLKQLSDADNRLGVSFLLESAEGDSKTGRFSMLGMIPGD